MSLRFLIDAQLPPALTHRLRSQGHDAEHVNDIGLGTATAREIRAYANKHKAVLVTKDQDFADLALREPGGSTVVWVRLGNTTNEALWRALEPVMQEIVDAIGRGERLIEVA